MSSTEVEAMTDPDTVVEPVLTLDQRRRVEALQVARHILENKPQMFAGAKIDPSRTVADLTDLGDWIIDGSKSLEPTQAVTGDQLRESDLTWGRRQGYVEGVKASATVVAAGGGTDDLNKLLGDDGFPETLPRFVPPDQSALTDGGYPSAAQLIEDAAARADLQAARSDADDGN